MLTYNPENPPEPDDWLSADESERIVVVQQWHKQARVKLPNEKAHAVFHVIVENQLAENLESVVRAVPRLMKQGLSRHDAVHAVGWVLASYIHELLTSDKKSNDQNDVHARYSAEVERLTAKAWQAQAKE